MDKLFQQAMCRELVWIPELGMGYMAAPEPRTEYWDQYVEKGKSPIADDLLTFRQTLVDKYTQGTVIDIGIGDGAFIRTRTHKTLGFDVDPKSIDWLTKKGLWANPYDNKKLTSLCFFDSLEHISEPHKILTKVSPGEYVFISIPIFKNCDHATYSKHYRPNEHIWYFTWQGLVKWMIAYGYEYVFSTDQENRIGREEIGTFVFRRTK